MPCSKATLSSFYAAEFLKQLARDTQASASKILMNSNIKTINIIPVGLLHRCWLCFELFLVAFCF